MDEEEDEIWDYKSIKRVKRNGCQQTKPPTKDSNTKARSSSNKVEVVDYIEIFLCVVIYTQMEIS